MNIAQWIYILSLALQLAGALVLLFGNLTRWECGRAGRERKTKGDCS